MVELKTTKILTKAPRKNLEIKRRIIKLKILYMTNYNWGLN
jgi:hypothetical protein